MLYSKYLSSVRWSSLKEILIAKNKSAKCWICERKNKLIVHHVKYNSVGHEIRYFFFGLGSVGDLATICYDCHQQIHFSTLIWILKFKTPLIHSDLLRRMYFLRWWFCIRKLNIIGFIPAFIGWLLV